MAPITHPDDQVASMARWPVLIAEQGVTVMVSVEELSAEIGAEVFDKATRAIMMRKLAESGQQLSIIDETKEGF